MDKIRAVTIKNIELINQDLSGYEYFSRLIPTLLVYKYLGNNRYYLQYWSNV